MHPLQAGVQTLLAQQLKGRFHLKKGVNYIFSNQFGIMGLPETWLNPCEPNSGGWFLFYKSPWTSVVKDNAAMVFCSDTPEILSWPQQWVDNDCISLRCHFESQFLNFQIQTEFFIITVWRFVLFGGFFWCISVLTLCVCNLSFDTLLSVLTRTNE